MAKKANSGRQTAKYRVFISYATEDRDIVKLIRDQIDSIGVDVVLDCQIIESGDSISARLQKALRTCNELLLYYSDSTKDKVWVHLEVGAAWVQKKRITVIARGQSLDPGRDWGMAWLSDLKYVSLNDFQESFLADLKLRASKRRSKNTSVLRRASGAKK